MFNAPRSPSNRYGSPLSNGLLSSTISVTSDPLVASAYIDPDAGLDPWSISPSPAPLADPPSALNAVLGDAQIPALYIHSFNTVDATGGGTITINALQRVLTTSSLPAADIDKIVNLVSSRPRVSKMEFYVALALAACAQTNKDVSIENVASLAKTSELPVPSLDMAAMNAISTSTIQPTFPPPAIVRPTPGYNPEADPWTTASRGVFVPSSAGNAASSILSTGLPPFWWKNQESITVTLHGQAGYIFNRYTLYQIQSFTRGTPVQRRYSEFVFLWDCLVKRYPFRILVGLPPKRIGPDESFIEQRRKGLQRFLNYAVNHPVIKEDGLLAVFLSEPNFDTWRRHNWISVDEESTTKRVESVQEMSIPSNLEAKLASTREKIAALIEHWIRLCATAERILKRREAAAGELARVTMTMNALADGNQSDPWGNVGDELASGVNSGVLIVAGFLGRLAGGMEARSKVALGENLEALKAQRDLYIAVRDLFVRHDRLAHDNVDKLHKRVDAQSLKLKSVKASAKEGWADEADKLVHAIERDQAAIQQALARRVFIRWCMWHEFRVVLRNRENTLLTLLVQAWTIEERDYSEAVQGIWSALVESVQSMPLE